MSRKSGLCAFVPTSNVLGGCLFAFFHIPTRYTLAQVGPAIHPRQPTLAPGLLVVTCLGFDLGFCVILHCFYLSPFSVFYYVPLARSKLVLMLNHAKVASDLTTCFYQDYLPRLVSHRSPRPNVGRLWLYHCSRLCLRTTMLVGAGR
jgi:hypothetical protein